MLKKKISSINFKTLLYLIIFSSTILLFLVISQNILLKISYEIYQEKKIKNLATKIAKTNIDTLIDNMELIAYQNNVCLEYTFENKTITYNKLMLGCELNKNNAQVDNLKLEIINSKKTVENIKLTNKDLAKKALLSGIKVKNGYIFMYTVLEDITTTNLVLKNQVYYIVIIFIILASFISYFLSIKITKPITIITKKAKEVGEGRYDVVFDRSDVLEIDELSLALNHMEKDLSKIDELRRDLMANVSHDLKTPLTMIKAYAEMVRDITYKDKKKMDDNLNVIISETERLNVLVNDILDLSKMQSDAEKLYIEEFDLVSLINNVINRYDILKKENYHFILTLPKKAIVKGDKKKLEQVIYNLINNAINYTGDDKTVYIRIVDSKKNYTFEVQDTGKGISKEEIPYIWDKYYKKDKKHQRNVHSTGIGLSIVKEILTKHKFDYGVKSVKKNGTIFYFKIKK